MSLTELVLWSCLGVALAACAIVDYVRSVCAGED